MWLNSIEKGDVQPQNVKRNDTNTSDKSYFPIMKYSSSRITTANKRRIGNNDTKKRESFYISREWKELSTRIIRTRGRRCEQCNRMYDDYGRSIRVFVDHIVELNDGGDPFAEQNVQVLCGSCHTKKTIAERVKRR